MNQKTLIGKKEYILFFLLFFGVYFASFSQSMELYKMFKSKEGNLNYLAPHLFLEKDTIDSPYKIQSQYTYYAYLHLFDKIAEPFLPKKKITDPKVSYKEAKQNILERTSSHKVVMFNEEHHNPFHRLYIETYLKDLKKQGFTIFTLETLNWEDTELNNRKYPISISGNYTREPYSANLVRKALELGYKVVPYESRDTLDYSIKTRERNQSNNLAKIIKKEQGKILVLAGYAHIAEQPMESGHAGASEWMAYLLNKDHGINPLTIDQTEMPIQKELHTVSIPYKNGKPYTQEEYDISVIYPREREYLHSELGKKKVEVISCKEWINKNMLVQFYVTKEYEAHKDKAIPYEQFLIDSISMNVYLDPRKRYTMILRDREYKIITKRNVYNFNKLKISDKN